ncbi:MAG: hypothetical protein DRO40_11035 [Thermoprotei archaeon]|nr:MAG: hypothetical protein DRO40_11035 [Thermoprotei archaeon]
MEANTGINSVGVQEGDVALSEGVLITSLSIENWRGIRRLEKPLKLKRFNILVGRNNTGKTSILEALALLPHPQLKRLYLRKIKGIEPTIEDYLAKTHWGIRSLMYKYANKVSINYTLNDEKPCTIKIVLDGKWDVKIRVDKDEFNVSITDKGKIELTREFEMKKTKVEISLRSSVLETITDILDSLEQKKQENAFNILRSVVVLFVPFDRLFYNGVIDFFDDVEVWSVVEAKGIHRRVVEELVNPVVDDVFTELHLGRRGVEIRREDGTWIHVKDLGSGIQRVIVMALLVEYVNPRLVAIDDVEVAMHPGLLKYFLGWLYDKGIQVVLSTHSRDVIEVFNELELAPDEAQVMVLFKGKDDTIRARYIDPDELNEMIEHGVDLRKALNLLEPSI